MKKFLKIFYALIITCLMLVLVIFPERYLISAFQGIKLWALLVLPSLFPFFFLTLLLTKSFCVSRISRYLNLPSKKLFNCSGVSFYVFFMSIISGYPVGARIIAELYDSAQIDKDEATRISVFTSTSGPLFIIGSVGVNMFGDKKTGLIIFTAHVLSAFINGLIFRFYGNKNFRRKLLRYEKTDNVLYESVFGAVISVLAVGGFICIFYVLAQILSDFKILFPLEKLFFAVFSKSVDANALSISLSQGLIECTKGCSMLALIKSPLSVSLACSLISFGGLSVIFQSIIFLNKSKTNVIVFVLGKIVQTITSFFLCYLLTCLF